jgi:protein TonB
MVHANSLSYSPYGAYELKAAYQRNMMTGLLCMVLVGFLIGGVMWLLQPPMETIIIPPQPPPGDPAPRPQPPPTIPRGRPDLPQPGSQPRGAIPVAVPDDSLSDIDTTVIISPAQYDYGDFLDNDAGGNGLFIDTTATDILLPPDTFIILEYYPEIISRAPLTYPEIARRAGMTGVVTIQVLLGKNGEPLKAIVARSSGYVLLDDAALEAAFDNTYKPGIQNGLPVMCWISYRVNFSLERDN